MKRKLVFLAIGLLPMMSYALGIPEENKQLIFSVTLTGIMIVILSLTVVSISVALMSKIIDLTTNRKKITPKAKNEPIALTDSSEDEIVAIATALHLEMRSLQEEEKAILTIRKVVKPFTAWNNKTYGMRNR